MEQYVKKPAAVQVFALNGATDIILRKDIASEKNTPTKRATSRRSGTAMSARFALRPQSPRKKSRRTSIRGGTISRRARLSL